MENTEKLIAIYVKPALAVEITQHSPRLPKRG